MTGDKDTRMAAMVLRDKLIEMRQEKRDIIIRLEHEPDPQLSVWILTGWHMEIQLLTNAIDDLEKQLIENEFDF